MISEIVDGAFEIGRMADLGRDVTVAVFEVDLRQPLSFG